jgi:anti-anti-sigma factor
MIMDSTGYGSGVTPSPTVPSPGPAPPDEWDGHLLLLHESEAERLAGLIAWARRGLERGEKVVLGEAPASGRPPMLLQLRRHGWDPAPALADRRLEVLPVTRLVPADERSGIVEAALADGFPSVRLAAESSAVLDTMSAASYRTVEQAMAELCRTGRVSALCQYARNRTSGPLLAGAIESHADGLHQRLLRAHETRDGIAVAGEVDVSNADVFEELVGAATRAAGPGGDACVDLAQLRFLDASGAGAALRASASFRDAGGRLRLVRASPFIARVLSLLQVDEAPGVVVVAEPGDGR